MQIVFLSTIFSIKIVILYLQISKLDLNKNLDYKYIMDNNLFCNELFLVNMFLDVDNNIYSDSSNMGSFRKPPAKLEAVFNFYNDNTHPVFFYIKKIQKFRFDPKLKDKYKKKKYIYKITKELANIKYL